MDVVIVVTTSSLCHAKSFVDDLMEQCTRGNYKFLCMESYQTGQWVLAGLNDVVVHIFQQDVRELFRIKPLWKESPALYGEMPTVSPHRTEPARDQDQVPGSKEVHHVPYLDTAPHS